MRKKIFRGNYFNNRQRFRKKIIKNKMMAETMKQITWMKAQLSFKNQHSEYLQTATLVIEKAEMSPFFMDRFLNSKCTGRPVERLQFKLWYGISFTVSKFKTKLNTYTFIYLNRCHTYIFLNSSHPYRCFTSVSTFSFLLF